MAREMCHWCGKHPATTSLTEYDRSGGLSAETELCGHCHRSYLRQEERMEKMIEEAVKHS